MVPRNPSVRRKHLGRGLAQSRSSVNCELPPPPPLPSSGLKGLMTGVRDGNKSLLSRTPGLDIQVGGSAVPWDREAEAGREIHPFFSGSRGRGQRLAATSAGSPVGRTCGRQRAPRDSARCLAPGSSGTAVYCL